MITKQDIEEIIGIKESYQLTERLLKVLADSAEIKNVFDKFMMLERDLSYDWFTNYFQEEQGDGFVFADQQPVKNLAEGGKDLYTLADELFFGIGFIVFIGNFGIDIYIPRAQVDIQHQT